MEKSTYTSSRPGALSRLLTNKCPRCRQGNIYKHQHPFTFTGFMEMHEKCPVCSLSLSRKPDFYEGASYVGYVLALSIAGITFLGWWLTIGFSFYDDSFFGCIGLVLFILIVLQPVLMRLSRTAWLWFLVEYYPGMKRRKSAGKKRTGEKKIRYFNLNNGGLN